MTVRVARPIDDYDPNWPAYWAQHPNAFRSVGSEGAGEGDGGEGGEGGEGAGSGGEGAGADHWSAAIKDEGIKGIAANYESQDKLLEALGYKAPEWRDLIADEDAKKLAKDSPDLDHFAKRALEMRQRIGKGFTPPGKDAKPEEVAAYRKAIGAGETAESYLEFFPQPEDGKEWPENVKAENEMWAGMFHELNVPTEVAKALVAKVGEVRAAEMEAQTEADKKFAEETDAALKKKWPGDEFDRNTKASQRAITTLAEQNGISVEDLKHIEMKDGRFLFDHPLIRQLFAPVGLEMLEGNLGPALTDAERDGLKTQIDSLQTQIDKAQADGKSKEANELYQKKLALIAKRDGNQSIVGAQGRAA